MEAKPASVALVATALFIVSPLASPGEPDAASVGRKIFLDTGLSQPPGQGCITCHSPRAAFADPRPVSLGAVAGRVGRRNAPTLMYASLIPSRALEEFYDDEGIQSYLMEGGLFHDGRAGD
ncbi:MAG: cytochrome-c peroxidase, partial [Verrucomicrobiales bacterium]